MALGAGLKTRRDAHPPIDTDCPAMQFFSNTEELLGELIRATVMECAQTSQSATAILGILSLSVKVILVPLARNTVWKTLFATILTQRLSWCQKKGSSPP